MLHATHIIQAEERRRKAILAADDDEKYDTQQINIRNFELRDELRSNKSERHKYTLKQLNQYRQKAAFRCMPSIDLTKFEELGVISLGAGLKISAKNGFKLRFHQRMKQINIGKNSIGYQNYIKFIPREDRTKHHPSTPPNYDLTDAPKKVFDKKVRYWKSKLHQWDNITSVEQIPSHLTTFIIKQQQKLIQNSSNRKIVKLPKGCSWSPKNGKKTTSRIDDDAKMNLDQEFNKDDEKRQDRVIYSPC